MLDLLSARREPEPGFLMMRGADGADHLCWEPHTDELLALLTSLPAHAAGRAVEQALLTCGLDAGIERCRCTAHLHEDRFGTCACGHTCVWHFEDGADAPCRGLRMGPAVP